MEPALIWEVEMIVTVVLYLQSFTDGEPQRVEVARLAYENPYYAIDLCSSALEESARDVGLRLAQSLRDFWATELKVSSFDLITERDARCRPTLKPAP